MKPIKEFLGDLQPHGVLVLYLMGLQALLLGLFDHLLKELPAKPGFGLCPDHAEADLLPEGLSGLPRVGAVSRPGSLGA